jgi:hypothetical protein
MHLIEILLPLRDNEGRRFEPELFGTVREELIEHFGGLTAFSRSPAEGLWAPKEGECSPDEILIFEVMTDWIERSWWTAYRKDLERRFRKDEIVVRVQKVERL